MSITIHAPAGGATKRACTRACGLIFQFTPLREGRLNPVRLPGLGVSISIHAPAGGATVPANLLRGHKTNFNSRPCGRGDRGYLYAVYHRSYFNSRPCGRGDFYLCGISGSFCISIHAPAGGATLIQRTSSTPKINFNSRPCGRGDTNHTPSNKLYKYFNSRPCGRGDPGPPHPEEPRSISIHAPAGGATEASGALDLPLTVFQFTPLREGRLKHRDTARHRKPISIHAPAGGATKAPAEIGYSIDLFQFTPLREGRRAPPPST